MKTWRRRAALATLAAVVVVGTGLAVALASAPPILLGGTRPEAPAISGGRVVWVDRAYGNADIFLYDAATGVTSRLTTDAADQVQPAISGDIVVWSDFRSGRGIVRALDLATGSERDLSPNVADQIRPSVSGNWVVWEDYRNTYNPGIYAFDIVAGTERRIASGYGQPMRRPKVSGNLVVWEDYSVASHGSDVKVFDLSTGSTGVVAGSNAPEVLPDTDGRWVVWAQAAGGGLDILAKDTATGITVPVSRVQGEQSFPGVSDGVAYWSDHINGKRLHVDVRNLSTKAASAFDDHGTTDVVGFTSKGGSSAWLARAGAGWRVMASINSPLGRRALGVFAAIPLRLQSSPLDELPPVTYPMPGTVTSVSVRQGQQGVGTRSSFRVSFSKAMDGSTKNLTNVYLIDERKNVRIRSRVSYVPTSRMVVVRPLTPLARARYALVVEDRMTDRSGAQIAGGTRVSFATGAVHGLDTVAPSAPGQVAARVDTRANVTISWTPAVDNVGVVGYDVYRSIAPTLMTNYSVDGSLVASVVDTSATVPVKSDEASKAYTYSYMAVSKDASGNKTPSANAVPDPHRQSTAPNLNLCSRCHQVHGAASGSALGAATASGCYACHGATAGTTQYGFNSTFDTQARFQDDSVIATGGPQRTVGPTGSIHRNATMVTGGHDCDSCHTPHRKPYDADPAVSYARLIRSQIATTIPTSTPWAAYRYNTETTSVASNVCFDCHGSPADNAQTLIGIVAGPSAYSNAGGDHRTNWTSTAHGMVSNVPTPAADLPTPAIQCVACHDEHGSKVPRLLGTFDTTSAVSRMIYGSTPTTLTGNDKSVCYGCHTNATPNYPAASENASGYPTRGTWPGKAAWDATYDAAAHTGSFHGTSTVVWPGAGKAGGDCKNCHVLHGSDGQEALDILRRDAPGPATFAPGNFTFCFKCHGGAGPAADDIKRYFPAAAGGTNAGTRSGHRTLSAGKLPPGSALPCYDCHNPHGSGSAYGLTIVTQSGGTTFTVGAASGQITMSPTTRTAADIRRFCFTCHTTADITRGWNGTTLTVVTAPARIEGIDRTVYNAAGAHLKLPVVSGHNGGDAQSCYDCHGNDYSTPTSNNVHSPSGGTSIGGQACYGCHSTYKDNMEDGVGTQTGSARTSGYHHVMGGMLNDGVTYADGDYAPGPAGTYPNNDATQLFCVTCHGDHDTFNANKGANLLESFGSTNTTNTDFVEPFGGLCYWCHGIGFSKDTTNQADDGTTHTVDINGPDYAGSAHQYSVTSTFASDGSTFRANCVKCHTDERPKQYQFPAFGFGTHFSLGRRLVSAFGGTVTDPLRQRNCFGCHSTNTDGVKAVAGRDYYGAAGATMSLASERIFDSFTIFGGSRHPTTPTAGNAVICENCHNPHEVGKTVKVSDPDNTLEATSYATTANKVTFCMACHDGSTPVYRLKNYSAYVPATVTIAPGDAGAMNKSFYASTSHWVAHGSISSAEATACGACHDPHGSNTQKLLGRFNPVNGKSYIGSQEITTTFRNPCYGCHAGASTGFPNYVRGSNGYPQDGTWPGKATMDSFSTGKHYFGCTDYCHDVHGNSGAYDEMGAGWSPASYSACFFCHRPGMGDNDILSYYPSSQGGGSSAPYAGHKTQTAGTLAAGSAMPCYDCHNPHGSADATALAVQTQSAGTTFTVGYSAGDFDIATADGVRRFCFTCHTTADTTEGYDGTTYTVVTAPAKVEGIDRISGSAHLHLPTVVGHAKNDAESCFTCHGNSYVTTTSNNVHNPGSGVSVGGQACYDCHATYENSMESVGSSRALSYHHVLGSATASGDIAPMAGSYPTSTVNVYCVSCHVDHNYFNDGTVSSRGANLRANVASSTVNTAASDFSTDVGVSYGVCESCHRVSQAKDTANQKTDTYSSTTARVGAQAYSVSSHQYSVASSFGPGPADVFSANCVKCHNDEQAKKYQTGPFGFGIHFSGDRRLLSGFGAPVLDPLRGNDCFGCHSETSDVTSGTTKPVAGRDAYGLLGASMDTTSQKTFKVFHLNPGSMHASPTVGPEGYSVSCSSCHNPHTTSDTTRVADPFNVYTGMAYTTVDEKVTFCLKCHSAGPYPTYIANDVTWVPITMRLNGGWVVDKTTNGVRGHWSATGSISPAERVACDVCHDKHGSSVDNLLGVYNMATGNNEISGTVITANDKSVCYACHTSGSTGFPTFSREASGYPTDGTWPGKAVYDTYSKHGGSCSACHDVHGTTGLWDEVSGFTTTDLSRCFGCHSGTFPTWGNIKSAYPVAVGGLSADARAGHKTLSAGMLPAGSALPCYDCHNVHGSGSGFALLIVTQSNGATIAIGDQAGEITTNTADGVRKLCFGCHTSADTGQGWTGSAWQAVLGTDMFEGIVRTPYSAVGAHLRLPPASGHNFADTTSCYGCHGNDYSLATSKNTHDPMVPPDHEASRTVGTVVGSLTATYTYGTNVGCFGSVQTTGNAGCHFSDLRLEHGTTAYLVSATGSSTVVQRSINGTRGSDPNGCTTCHPAMGTTPGTYASSTNVVAAVTNGDYRCVSCHSQPADNATGVHRPHETTEVLGGSTLPSSTSVEWSNWAAVGGGGGHNSITASGSPVFYPTTLNGKTINGVAITTNKTFQGTLIAPWNVRSVVRCVACHTQPATLPNGPHGAAVPFYLAGAKPALPLAAHWYSDTLQGTTSPSVPAPCSNCHSAISAVHTSNSNHSGAVYTCEKCHIRIPHAWKRPRLLRRMEAAGGSSTEPIDSMPYATSLSSACIGFKISAGSADMWGNGALCDDNCRHSSATAPYWP